MPPATQFLKNAIVRYGLPNHESTTFVVGNVRLSAFGKSIWIAIAWEIDSHVLPISYGVLLS